MLDLACGAGLLRIALARRMPTREIHYTGIDRNRLKLTRIKWGTRSVAQARGTEHPVAKIPESAPEGDGAGAPPERLKERFIHTELDLHDPGKLATQLSSLLGDERFNEVHLHLLHPSKHGRQPTGPDVLRAIAKYLRPGGRLYHLFQNSSPLFDFLPERIPLRREAVHPASGTRRDRHGRNEQCFREGALKGGLLLDKCGHRGAHKKWITRSFAGSEPDRRTTETYDRLAEQHSEFSKFATHFVILRNGAGEGGECREGK